MSMVGKGALLRSKPRGLGRSFRGFKVEGRRGQVEEIFGGVKVRKGLARDGLYKGVDEDSRKKQDGC